MRDWFLYVIGGVLMVAFALSIGISSYIQGQNYKRTPMGSSVVVTTPEGTVSTYHIPGKGGP